MSGILLAHRHAAAKKTIVLPAIGAAFMGGFYAGIIDPDPSAMASGEYFTTPRRFAVIVSDKSLESASGLRWKSSTTAGPPESRTLWNGLDATAAMVALGAAYEAAAYCNALAYPADGASPWYLPAVDELELIYRNLKCSTESNDTQSNFGAFPPYSHASGDNPSSSPVGVAYTAGTPSQTLVAAFQSGGAQALGSVGTSRFYWSATEYADSNAWNQSASGSTAGRQYGASKTLTTRAVRPIRRLYL